MDWYYANERDEQVQVSEDQLRQLAQSGGIQPDTFIWNESMDDWKAARLVKPEWFLGAGSTGTVATRGASTPGSDIIPTAPLGRPPSLPQPPPPTDGMALASLICGITGLVFMGCYGAGTPISIAAVICGHLCRQRLIREGNSSSAAMAMAGLITGYIGVGLIVLALIGILVFIAFFSAAASAAGAAEAVVP